MYIGIDFGVGYEREEFLRFLRNGFLPGDFRECVEEVDLTLFSVKYTMGVRVLGECESLDLVVFEIEHNSIRDASVSLAKETYKILKNSFNVRALVIYKAKDSENYRFSFLEYSINEKNKRENLNPKRYSYYLGKGIATHTPNKYLLEKGVVTSVEDLRSRFSVEVLTKEFYNELFLWYQWTLTAEANIFFPKNSINEERLDTKIIRLITRIIFVWFIKQKDLVPEKLFDTCYLNSILKDFNPLDEKSGTYYNAILQNLFFATLNRAIIDEKGNKRCFAKAKGQTDLKTLYRYEEMFSIGKAEVVELFAGVPFLNGGLFECLDKVRRLDGVEKAYYYDGFSRNEKIRATIPNRLFFDKERGLINIFKRYNFTVEENAPNDIEVSLDPELLGKVFENLLGVYNPETSQTARNATGSFYTPREIVGYMVDESLKQYLGKTPEVEALFDEDFSKQEGKEEEYLLIAEKLKKVKILDPACGSGAFPMGLLNRMVDLLEKILTDKTPYELKLAIIEHCIYGVDIQNIAVQISKLRFFISLICDCEKDETKQEQNYNIPTLPNLETKFVAANTLIGKKKKIDAKTKMGNMFDTSEIETLKLKIHTIRHEHFLARNTYQKEKLRDEDRRLRQELAKMLEDSGNYASEDAKQMAYWDPYDQNATTPFFDAEWMFGIKDGFDIVIGNPPYFVINNSTECKQIYEETYAELRSGRMNIYQLFFGLGTRILSKTGVLTFIHPKTLFSDAYLSATRQFLMSKYKSANILDIENRTSVFDNVLQSVVVTLWNKRGNGKINVATIRTKQDILNTKYIPIDKDIFYTTDRKFLVAGKGEIYQIVDKTRHTQTERLQFSTGSIEWNRYRDFLSGNKQKGCFRLIFGENIQRFYFAPSYRRADYCFLTDIEVRELTSTAILTQRTTSVEQRWRIFATLVKPIDFDTKLITENSTNVCLLKNDRIGKYYLGVLNSKFMDFYFRLFNSNTHVSSGELNNLPIATATQEEQKEIILLVDKIMTIKQKDNEADTSSLEKQIDNLVYKLYNLTDEEIKIIENLVR